MSVIVFIGPTLPKTQAQQYLTADYRPPAQQGDVYRASLEQPKVILIIDGFFESIPAVWHKEVLYAMAQGIHVYGAASIGALRAAELNSFGMQGFGEVYRQFSLEILEDDDEVAVIHAPQEMGFMVVSEAMVNIRATLQAAHQAGVITSTQSEHLMQLAKQTWYPQRSFSNLLKQAHNILPLAGVSTLSDFIKSQSIDIKQQDAIGLLQHIDQHINQISSKPKQVDYTFTNTDAWDTMVEQSDAQDLIQHHELDIDSLLLELKLSGIYRSLTAQARERQTALNQVKAMADTLNPQELQHTLKIFAGQYNCIIDGQIDFSKLAMWLTSQRLDQQGFERLIVKQGQLSRLETTCPDYIGCLLDILRLNSQLGELYERIAAKRDLKVGDIKVEGDLVVNEAQLWQWYFDTYLQKPIPSDLSIYAQLAGFDDLNAMRHAVVLHYQWACTQ